MLSKVSTGISSSGRVSLNFSTGNGNPLEIGLQTVLEDEFLVGDGSLFQTAVALILAESRYPAERKGEEAKEAVHFFITVISIPSLRFSNHENSILSC